MRAIVPDASEGDLIVAGTSPVIESTERSEVKVNLFPAVPDHAAGTRCDLAGLRIAFVRNDHRETTSTENC